MQVIKSKEKKMIKGPLKTFVGCEHCGGETKIETKQVTMACTTCGAFLNYSYQSFEETKKMHF